MQQHVLLVVDDEAPDVPGATDSDAGAIARHAGTIANTGPPGTSSVASA